jgi:hypothetical protein
VLLDIVGVAFSPLFSLSAPEENDGEYFLASLHAVAAASPVQVA